MVKLHQEGLCISDSAFYLILSTQWEKDIVNGDFILIHKFATHFGLIKVPVSKSNFRQQYLNIKILKFSTDLNGRLFTGLPPFSGCR